MTEPRRREKLRPAELVGLAALVAAFLGLVTFLVTRDLVLSLLFFGGTFVFDLVVLAMLMLAVTPNKPAEDYVDRTGIALVLTALSLGNTVRALLALTLAAAGVSSAQAAFWSLPSALLSGAGAAAGIALVNSIGNVSSAVSTSLVGWLSEVTGSPASTLYAFGVVMVVGGATVLLLPARLVDDPARRSDEVAARRA